MQKELRRIGCQHIFIFIKDTFVQFFGCYPLSTFKSHGPEKVRTVQERDLPCRHIGRISFKRLGRSGTATGIRHYTIEKERSRLHAFIILHLLKNATQVFPAGQAVVFFGTKLP
jgi:hypothetical protein